MAGGQITDGLIDFTGGIDESIMLNLSPSPPGFKEEIKHLLRQAYSRKSMMGCAILEKDEDDNSGYLDNGLITGKISFLLMFQNCLIRYNSSCCCFWMCAGQS
jgi:hypothetical protein